MKRTIEQWRIKNLVNEVKPFLGFPEFQRESTVWDLYKKQKLIDSILRGFDIGTIYLYKRDEDSFECIDGKQRINAIYSFLGLNEGIKDSDNNFKIRIENDIYTDTDEFLLSLNGKKLSEMEPDEKGKFTEEFEEYKLNIILLSSEKPNETQNEQELSLQFIRLQFASQLNAGEKLHAMSGDMHHFIFKELFTTNFSGNKYEHPFFASIDIPYRRYAKEQVAAQITLNYFGLRNNPPSFSRSRYIDLQYFFKTKTEFKQEDKTLIEDIKQKLDTIVEYFKEALSLVESRAIAVTTFLFAAQLINEKNEKLLSDFKEFLIELIATLKWQLKLYRSAKQNVEYREIFTDFQNYITQAAGESYAIERRHKFIEKYFKHYLTYKEILGDSEFKRETGKSARNERNNQAYKQMKLSEG